jgi:hypothetical protein
VGFISETFRAMLSMGLPVGVFSFGLVWWAISRGYVSGEGGVDGIGKEIKALSDARKKNRKERKKIKKGKAPEREIVDQKFDPVQEKWMKFGGGFYGVVAFYTYILIEWNEIVDFIMGFGGFLAMLGRVSVGAVVELIINSIMNFVAAIAWPFYWISNSPGEFFWIWFIVAYAGYWVGIKVALLAVQRKWGFGWLFSSNETDDEV